MGPHSDALYDSFLAVPIASSLASERHMAKLSRIYSQQNGSGYITAYIFDQIGAAQRKRLLSGMKAPDRRAMAANIRAEAPQRKKARKELGGSLTKGVFSAS